MGRAEGETHSKAVKCAIAVGRAKPGIRRNGKWVGFGGRGEAVV